MKIKTSSLLLFLLFSISLSAQNWKKLNETHLRNDQNRFIKPSAYKAYSIDVDDFKHLLKDAPERFSGVKISPPIIHIPRADGTFDNFKVYRADVFHENLSARYPGIKSFTAINIDQPGEMAKISVSHKGIDIMILSDSKTTEYVDRYLLNETDKYIVYSKNNYQRTLEEGDGLCHTQAENIKINSNNSGSRFGDCQLRKYRLALACTGEYATYHGGTISDVLAEYNTSMNRVNGIYERDAGITMELIENTDQLIFFNSNTDPYTNNDGGVMLGQNQSTCDQIIGTANYDIGHVYSTGGGGIASLGSPCSGNRKARGVTGLPNPVGDPFYVDYVAHEMGHQYGGNHTFNNSCGGNRNSSTAAEPGSGSTIMAYAGICSPNVQNNSDDHFHAVSLFEMADFVVAGGGGCAEIITTDNTTPDLEPLFGNNHMLPIGTPFSLTAEATDAEGDPMTYCWEQMDVEIASMPPSPSSTGGPMFRSLSPSTNKTRYFPALDHILDGSNQDQYERLTNVERSMSFNVTVRDNNPTVGCTQNDMLTLNFTASAGPFLMTSLNQTNPDALVAGTTQTITWDVANTDTAPVNCENVDILLSIDGGQNFDIVVADDIPNNGSADIVVPFEFSSTCRMMVKCATSVFLDINNSNFEINAPFNVAVLNPSIEICGENFATYNLSFIDFTETNQPVTFSTENAPMNTISTFTPENINEDGDVILELSGIETLSAGVYPFNILATDGSLVQSIPVSLTVSPLMQMDVDYLFPEDGQINVPPSTSLSWELIPGINSYEIQVDQTPAFSDPIVTTMTNEGLYNFNQGMAMTVYYWRVRGLSGCFDTNWTTFQSFQTSGLSCIPNTFMVNLPISDQNVDIIEDVQNISQTGVLQDIEVSLQIDHTYIGDLSARLQTPTGQSISLFDRPGVPEQEFGCDQDNMVVTFSSSAPNTAEDLENTCDNISPAIIGIFMPIDDFNVLNGSDMSGDWKIIIEDSFGEDGGELISWSLSLCSSADIPAGNVLKNNTLMLIEEAEKAVTSEHLEVQNMDPLSTYLTMRSLPSFGKLQKLNSMSEYEDISLGERFTQANINDGKIKYVLTDVDASEDNFLFDTEDELHQHTSANKFNIQITLTGLSGAATIIEEITCNGDMDGSITATVSGGFSPFTYSLDGQNFVSDPTFANLAAGIYSIIIKDNTGNEVVTNEVTLEDPEVLTGSITVDGQLLTIEVAGGISPYEYSDSGGPFTTSNTIDVVDAQIVDITIKDARGCELKLDPYTHYQITAADHIIQNVSCKDGSDGNIEIGNITGGLTPYTYELIGTGTNDNGVFENLSEGTFTVQITDDSGSLFLIEDIVISEPSSYLLISTQVVENSINIAGLGGTPPYQYSLDGINYQDEGLFEDLDDGTYTGFVRDANGCINTANTLIIDTAVEDERLSTLSIFPNPARDKLFVESPFGHKLKFIIIDILGKTVKTGVVTNQINISNLENGTYLVKFHTDVGMAIRKLIVH